MSDTGAPHNLPYPGGDDDPNVPADVQALAEAIHARLTPEAARVVGAGGQPALNAGWTASSGGLRFWKDAAGRVWFAGRISAAGTPPALIFTLPAGYRPVGHTPEFIVDHLNQAYISIAANGEVTLVNGYDSGTFRVRFEGHSFQTQA